MNFENHFLASWRGSLLSTPQTLGITMRISEAVLALKIIKNKIQFRHSSSFFHHLWTLRAAAGIARTGCPWTKDKQIFFAVNLWLAFKVNWWNFNEKEQLPPSFKLGLKGGIFKLVQWAARPQRWRPRSVPLLSQVDYSLSRSKRDPIKEGQQKRTVS